MKLGDTIFNFRKSHGMSMDDFANVSGISKAYISLLEKGRHPKSGKPIIPSITTIQKAADAMGITFEELFSNLDQQISVEEVTAPEIEIKDNGDMEIIYQGFTMLPEVTQERLKEYFKAIIETEVKNLYRRNPDE